MLYARILLLLFIANGIPILIARLLGTRGDHALDGGKTWRDGRPIFGPSKTWRGVLGSLLFTPLLAPWLGFSPWTGLLVAGATMAGDLFSSFCKRRLGIASSGMALGLDQIPEALFPLLLFRGEWGLAAGDIVELVGAFLIWELVLSRLLYWLHIRKQPY
ncbi:CDP-archaeol synthase [Methylococcus sp. EFPC2]|uniref:CDP-archaeol synthase n=1 Tax=Methylococcus sp. EFPC2 TaxID=2812648 RepID=UPI00196717D9|nr:CDP-archaeol synthase [Methylococcus sp. EFPC2]QSA96046.1 CDP-archaeol synthase [Methylococcus sp. EFPC2]